MIVLVRKKVKNFFFFLSFFANLLLVRTSFCLQAFDGPCPLLAIANVLLLRARLRIRDGEDRLKTSHVLSLIGDSLTENLGSSKNDQLMECLTHLRELQGGLQVNCGFAHCTSFERVGKFQVFEMLGINIYHGWIPEERDAADVLEKMTYNEAMVRLFCSC